MIYLLLSILSSSLIFIIFKWLGKLEMNTILIIVFNYLTAAIVGFILSDGLIGLQVAFKSEWIIYTIALGFGFVGMFYAMARATHISGTAPAVVANKMSVVIPVVIAFLFLGDSVSMLKILGISLALIGIFFATKKKYKSSLINRAALLLMLIFFGSGLVDTSIKLLELFFVQEESVLLFTSVLFLSAFCSGLVILSFNAKRHISSFKWSKVLMGFALGLVNFGSIYFLVLALKTEGMQSSVLFPMNNIGVVIVSTFLSVVLFKEKLSKHNVAGISISVAALILLMLA